MPLPEFSIVVPVYNEAENIACFLRGIEQEVRGDYELLVVYDFDEDNTLTAIEALQPPMPRLRLVKNELGRGVVNAIRCGFAASRGWLGAIVTMADLSDPPDRINALTEGLRQGLDVVAGSRYMRGGQQVGGPLVKRTLSRWAGCLAYWLTGIGVHDVTTNYRAYSRRLIVTTQIESKGGFELGLELTVKCHLRGWRVGEVPSGWRDRSAGQSRFRLIAWLPGYLRWYLRLLAGDPFGWGTTRRRRRSDKPLPSGYEHFYVSDDPGYGWTANRYRDAVVVIPVTADGRLVLVRVHRPFHDREESDWELPGGAADMGETPLLAAHRELLEETGYASDDKGELASAQWQAVPGMGYCPHYVVVLRDCRKTGDATHMKMESIREVREFTADEVGVLVETGGITAIPSIAAALAFLRRRKHS